MNLSIVRTTEAGKEALNIKDASENIAYAVLRRFLPEQKDMLTPDPIQVKVHSEKPSDLPNFLTSDTAGVLNVPVEAKLTSETVESVKTLIKNVQDEVRKELHDNSADLGGDLKEKPAAEDEAIYKEPTVIRKGGKELYTVKVDCDDCGHSGSRLTTPHSFYVKCRACENKLAIDQMYDTPFMANSEGFAFKADTTFIPSGEQKVKVQEEPK